MLAPSLLHRSGRDPRTGERPAPGAILLLVLPLCFLLGACADDDGGGTREVPRPASLDAFDATLASTIRERVKSVSEAPGDVAAWKALGYLYEAHHMESLALATYEEVVRLAPRNPRLAYRLAVQQAKAGALEAALGTLGITLEGEPGYAPAHLRQGSWLWELGRHGEARAAYERVPAQAEAGAAARLGLAQVDLDQGDFEGVLVRLAEPESLPAAARALAHQLRGTALARLGRDSEANEELTLGRGARPYLPDPWSRAINEETTGAAATYLKAARLLDRGRVTQATTLLEQVYASQPREAHILRSLAEAYARQDRLMDTERVLAELVDLDPEDPQARLGLGRVRIELGRHGQALVDIEGALALEPGLEEALLARIAVLQITAGATEIETAVEAARKHGVDTVGVVIASGKVLLEQEKPDEALVEFTRAAEEEPLIVDAWIGKALALVALGRTKDAQDALDQAALLSPEHPMVVSTRATIEAQAEGPLDDDE